MTGVRALVPREHGFWVMLGAALLASLLRADFSVPALAVAAPVVVAAAALGGLTRRHVRREAAAQLGAAALLGLSGVPIERAAGLPTKDTAAVATAWLLIFVSSALVVRAAMARARRGGQRDARFLDRIALSLPLAGAISLAALGRWHVSLALLLGLLGLALLSLLALSVKRMKTIGLSLAGIAVAVAFALGW
jgi:hypothetical protein